MVAGQGALSGPLDVGALTAVETRLEERLLARGAAHVGDLRDALEVHRLYADAGMAVSAVPHLALVLRCSEQRAAELLGDAQVLVVLPGAFDVICGDVLRVDDVHTVCAMLEPLRADVRLAVWEQVFPTLQSDLEQAVVRPRARLRELVDRLVKQVDAAGAQQRRKQASDGRAISYRRRDDGLVDLFAFGLTGPNAQACPSRIRDAAAPLGPDDERTADQRRCDAFVSLLTGREQLLLDAEGGRLTEGPTRAGGCSCSPMAEVPCGAQVTVLVPLGAALGTTDQVAELVGHGPIEPDLLEALLLASPELRAVFVDEDGMPVAEGGKERPERGHHEGLRAALLRLAHSPPPTERVPRHPDDHRVPPDDSPPDDAPPDAPAPPEPPPVRPDPVTPQVLAHAHPAGTPGPYRVPARLRRLLQVRAPRCEWPGCGARAACCDQDHDLAWPYGPTCGCNLGSLCRRHHRVKQTGWLKTRRVDGVRWTSPSGRPWLSHHQHTAPAASVRPLPPAPATDPWQHLSPLEHEQARSDLDASDPRLDGPVTATAPVEDVEPEDDDRLGAALLDDLTRWTLDFDDPTPGQLVACNGGELRGSVQQLGELLSAVISLAHP